VTLLADTLAIVHEFLSWSVDTGFLLVLPLHHEDLELDSVGVSTKDDVAVLVAWPWLEGPICKIKIPVQELGLKMWGGAYMWDTTVHVSTLCLNGCHQIS